MSAIFDIELQDAGLLHESSDYEDDLDTVNVFHFDPSEMDGAERYAANV